MAIRLWRWTSLATTSLLAIGVSVACGPISLPVLQSGSDPSGVTAVGQPASVPAQAVANATATPSKPRPGALRSVPVRRDSLAETMALDGAVTAQTQEPIMYGWRSIVDDVKVKPGQAVKKGDVLIEFSQGDLPKTLDTARSNLEAATANLALAQAQAEAAQAATAERVAADQKKQQQAMLDAQVALSRAQDNLTRVKAGKTPTEKQVADTAVTDYGTTQVAAAQLALDAAMAGPDDNTIRLAQRDVSNAQLAVNKAQADLNVLTGGPDPAALRAAQTAVQRAQSTLQIAQAAKIDPKAPDQAVAKMQHDNAIEDAQAALDNAQAQVAKLKQPPADIDVQAAKNRVVDTEATLSAAQDKLDKLQAGPDPAAIASAEHQLEATKHALAEVTAIRDEVYSHPTPAELNSAEDQVRAAQAALDNASQAPTVTDAAGPDIAPLQKVIIQDQADIAAAQAALDNTHLRAPFDGTVVSIQTKPGEMPAPSKPVIILARPGPPIVRIDLDDSQAKRVAVGQSADIQIGTGTTAVNAAATVSSVTPGTPDGSLGASANMDVSWAEDQTPKLGTPVQVTLHLGVRQDVLVVPKSAVRQSGGRATVEVQEGTIRHLVSVQVGLSTADSVEIVSGLTEGQMVLAGPA